MLVSVDDLSSVKKTLHFEIPNDIIARELDTAYNDLKGKVRLKGFRPGKAPRGVLEQYFRKDVHADVTSKLIQSSLLDAIKEKDFKIVGTPQIDPPELKSKESYRYSATVEIRPEIEDVEFKGLTLKKNLYEVSDEEMEKQLSLLQNNMATQEKIEEDRPIDTNDIALVDYEGFQDGQPFSDFQKAENASLKVGEEQIHPAFDENIIGMKPGEEKEFSAAFPEDHANKNLSGQSIDFKITLKEIRKEVLPELDDVFAKKMGEYENIDDLKDAITENLEKGYEKRIEQELNEQIYESLLSTTEFEVPDALVEFELNNIVSDAERYFAQYDVQMEDAGITREKLSEDYRDLAIKQVKRHLILNKIIEQEDLTLSDEAQEEGYKEMSESFRQPVEQIKNYYRQNKEALDAFKQVLLEKQAIRLIIENSSIEEVEPEPVSESDDKEDKKE